MLTINRPEVLNSINSQVIDELGSHVEALQRRKDVTVVTLHGAGEKAFVAGADIKEMQNLTPKQAQEFSKKGSQVFLELETLPQIVIAVVQGFALGGGLELAMASDFIIASNQAKFGLPEVSLGLIPGFGGTQRLARRIGMSRALQWVTSAEKYSASDALLAGLVTNVVAAEELGTFVKSMVQKILKNGPEAVKLAKFLTRQSFDLSTRNGCEMESGYFGLTFQTPESQEGLRAFTEKRPAQFSLQKS